MVQIDKDKRYGFMPGCSLPSYNPEAVGAIVAHLQSVFPKFSVVQKCCGKPTKAVGQYEKFKERFGELENDMKAVEIDVMIVACQSCKLTLDEYSSLPTISLWEILPLIGLPKDAIGKGKDSDMEFCIHDSCSTRFEKDLQDGIRWAMDQMGYKYAIGDHEREKTRCCGFGGMIVPVKPELAKRVMQKRVDTLPNQNIVVYCSACRQSMMKVSAKSWHILDLIFGPVVYKGDKAPEDVLSSPVKSWVNRYKSKKAMGKELK